MKKLSKYKVLVICILSFILLICILILKYKFNHKSSIENNTKFYPYIFFQDLDENTLNKSFQNRSVNLNKQEKEITIGRNKKEINNGYFDMKFIFNEDKLEIYINKLTKEEKTIDIISQEYLNELDIFVDTLLKSKYDQNIINKNIYEEFSKLRENMQVKEDTQNLKVIDVENYTIEFSIEKNMLKLEIKL